MDPCEAAPVRPRLHASTSIPSLQAHESYHPNGNTSCSFISYLEKECKYRSSGNPPCHRGRLSCGTWTFSKASGPGPLHGRSQIGHIDTADSDLMHHLFRLTVPSGTQAQSARTHQHHRSDLWTVVKRLFFKKSVITFPSPISSLRTLSTRTSPPC